MHIKILGPGCTKCEKLFAETKDVIAELGGNIEIEKISKMDEIVKFGVMMTPAFVLNDEVKSSGRVPPRAEIINWITTAAPKA